MGTRLELFVVFLKPFLSSFCSVVGHIVQPAVIRECQGRVLNISL